MGSPVVSIIMATYNREEWLPNAMESVLNQTYQDWELIIWDDGSQDDTREVVASYKDKRIHYHYAKNHGMSYALNQALKLVNGIYIAFLDDDDEWFPDKLDFQVNVMQDYPEIDILFTNFYNINTYLSKKGQCFEQHREVLKKIKIKEIISDTYLVISGIPEQLLKSNIILPSSVMMKRSCYQKTGNFKEDLRNAMDLEYWWRLGLSNAQFAYTDRVLLNRYKQPDSLSRENPITYLNHIKALGYCLDWTLTSDRKDLIPSFKPAYLSVWQELIRIYALQGDRKQAIMAFNNSIAHGLSWRATYLIIVAILGSTFTNLVHKRES